MGVVARFLELRTAEGLAVSQAEQHGAELYLGCACAVSAANAHQALETNYIGDGVARALAHMRLPNVAVQEVAQAVRETLLLGEEPRIGKVVGGGSLKGLINVMSVRLGLNWLRDHGRYDEPLEEPPPAQPPTPELAHMKKRYRNELKQAFELAADQITSEDRALLRFHLVEELSIDDVAAIYGIHRATAARRITRARDQLGAEARRVLARKAGLHQDDYASVVDLVESQLDLSLTRVLRTRSDAG